MNKQIKTTAIIIAGLVVIGLIVLVVIKQPVSQLADGDKKERPEGVPEEMLANQDSEAAQATQDLINDLVVDNNQEIVEVPGMPATEPELDENGEMIVLDIKPIKMVIAAPGTSGINVETGKVVDERGVELSNEAQVGSQIAPQESYPIDPKDLPKSAIRLEVNSTSFSPAEFTVNRGQAVNLAVTNVNDSTSSERLRFDDQSLKAVTVGLPKGVTKSITFNAPSVAGEYTFYSDMFNHRDQGAVGKMIVK